MVNFVKYRQVTESENLDPILKLMFDVLDERQLKYKCVADAIGVSPASLKNWRAGRTTPTLFNIRCMFQYLGLELTASINKETVNNE